MKKTVLMMTLIIGAITGCNKNGADTVPQGLTIDNSAHSITINIDNPVETFWITDSETSVTTEGIFNEDTQTITCHGDWYTATVDLTSPKGIILTVDENSSQKERALTISAYHIGKSGSMLVTQKTQ